MISLRYPGPFSDLEPHPPPALEPPVGLEHRRQQVLAGRVDARHSHQGELAAGRLLPGEPALLEQAEHPGCVRCVGPAGRR